MFISFHSCGERGWVYPRVSFSCFLLSLYFVPTGQDLVHEGKHVLNVSPPAAHQYSQPVVLDLARLARPPGQKLFFILPLLLLLLRVHCPFVREKASPAAELLATVSLCRVGAEGQPATAATSAAAAAAIAAAAAAIAAAAEQIKRGSALEGAGSDCVHRAGHSDVGLVYPLCRGFGNLQKNKTTSLERKLGVVVQKTYDLDRSRDVDGGWALNDRNIIWPMRRRVVPSVTRRLSH